VRLDDETETTVTTKMTRRECVALSLMWAHAASCRAVSRSQDGGVSTEGPRRIVSAGGAVTEVVVALGARGRLVGVDASSTHPADLRSLAQVGYVRALSAEGVLSLRPDVLVTTTDAGPPATLAQLRQSGLRVEVVPATPSVEGARQRIRQVARLLSRPREGIALVSTLDAELAAARQNLPRRAPRVVFLYARGGGTAMVAGRDTAADAMIGLAGGRNVITAWEGYRPLTAEALATAAPDVLLLTSAGMGSLGGPAAIAGLPGMALTPAGRAGRIVALDDLLLLGFGPRLGQAVAALATRFREVSA